METRCAPLAFVQALLVVDGGTLQYRWTPSVVRCAALGLVFASVWGAAAGAAVELEPDGWAGSAAAAVEKVTRMHGARARTWLLGCGFMVAVTA